LRSKIIAGSRTVENDASMTGRPVTIGIPCFNAQDYVGESIESALSQTYEPKEIIVVDDASTDASWNVIRSYAGRIRAIRLGANVGNAAARNIILKQSSGTLIQFHDADDVMLPTKLEAMVPLLEERQADAVLCDVGFFRGTSRTPDHAVVRYTGLEQSPDLLAFAIANAVLTISPIWRREVLESVGGFREKLRRCVDYDLALRIARSGGRWAYIPRVLTRARIHSNGTVSGEKDNVRGTSFCLLRALEESLRESQQLSEVRRQALARRYRWIGFGYFGDNREARAAAAFRRAQSCCPAIWRRGGGGWVFKRLTGLFGYLVALRARKLIRSKLGRPDGQSIGETLENRH